MVDAGLFFRHVLNGLQQFGWEAFKSGFRALVSSVG
jgi:hypothetical protein